MYPMKKRLLNAVNAPLINTTHLPQRLRFYSSIVLLVMLSVPIVHLYMSVSLSWIELIIHTGSITIVAILVLAITELAVSGYLRSTYWDFDISVGAFWLHALLGWAGVLWLIDWFHDLLPIAQTIKQKHDVAGYAEMSWRMLPVFIVIGYIAYQMIQREVLKKQIKQLTELNGQLDASTKHDRLPANDVAVDSDINALNRFVIPQTEGDVALIPTSVVRIHVDENYCYVFVNSNDTPSVIKKYVVRMTLSQAINQLPEFMFVQTHRSHLVNMQYIAKIIRDGRSCQLRLYNDELVPVSRARVAQVKATVQDFLARGYRPGS